MKCYLLLVSVSVLICGHLRAADLYVALSGNDANPGTVAEPFATLERARDEIRRMKTPGPLPTGGVTVWIRGGDYCRTNTLELSGEDSGSPDAPVVWRAYPGESPRLLGGRKLTGFGLITDSATLVRFAPEARPHIRQMELRAVGITHFGEMKSRGKPPERALEVAHCELFAGGSPMTLARWPNAPEFLAIAGPPEPTPSADAAWSLEDGFLYTGNRPQSWQKSEDHWVHGYWSFDWANSYERVATLDAQQHLVKTAPPYGIYSFRKGQRFFFLNVLEELDQPGEWFLDRKEGLLYFWPPGDDASDVLLSLLPGPLLKLQDACNITFQQIIFEATCGNGIEITGGTNDRIAGCVVRNVGNYGVMIHEGTNHQVTSCDIFDTGDGGVFMKGGDRSTLTPGDHLVDNCHFARQGRWTKCYVPAVRIEGVGLRVSHNLIHDHPHAAIIFLGNDHLIEFNEIHHIALETGDVGAIYAGADYTFRGNWVRNNFIHHTGGVGIGSMGVYMDDCVSGTKIFGNIFLKVPRAVFLGGGRDMVIENNIFVDCDPAIEMDARGLDPSPAWRPLVNQRLRDAMKAVPLALYRQRYPEMISVEAFYGLPNGPEITGEAFRGIPPVNIIVANNICVGKWLNLHWFATPDMLTMAGNITDAQGDFARDPRSAARPVDFELTPTSNAWRDGFERIPAEKIGLYTNELRRSQP